MAVELQQGRTAVTTVKKGPFNICNRTNWTRWAWSNNNLKEWCPGLGQVRTPQLIQCFQALSVKI